MSLSGRPRRALVTGGAGFIGSALARVLLAEGSRVLVYDRLDPGREAFLPHGVELVVGDIRDAATFRRAVNSFQPDVIFHAAALHFIPDCDAHPQETLRINVEGLEVVARTANEMGVPRLVFCSTAAIYTPFDGLSCEVKTAAKPIDIYGHSKYFGEQLVGWAHKNGPTDFVIARLFNVYGPRETNRHLIPDVMAQILRGKNNVQLGNVCAQRDYVFVDDAARALQSLGSLPVGPEDMDPVCVNVCTGRRSSAKDVLNVLGRLTGRDLSWEEDPTRLRARDRPVLAGDPSHLVKLIGWAPDTDLESGLARLLSWVQENPGLVAR